jgi:hypothetical protein
MMRLCRRRLPLALAARGKRLPLRRRELHLPQADALRRHLDALVAADELQRLLEGERARRNEPDEPSAVEERTFVSFFSLAALTVSSNPSRRNRPES